jgi:hypothetical protein
VPLDVTLPSDPRVRGLVVTPHALDRYDRLSLPSEHAEEKGKP